MNEWRDIKLKEVIKFGNGKKKPNSDGMIPIYGGNGILGHSSESNYDNETIIIGRVGAYCGSVYYENKPIWVSDNALSAKPKNDNNTKFLYYFLKHSQLNQHAGGSSHPLVTQTLLNSLEYNFCMDTTEQKAIAEVLSSLDDKIDLLHRQNKTLEELAQTLFRQWFIEEAKDEWEEYEIRDFATHKKVSIKPAQNPNDNFLHYSLPAFDTNKEPNAELGSDIKSNKYRVESFSILMSKLNPKTPRVWDIYFEPEKNSICSTEFQVVEPNNKELFPFISTLLKSEKVKGELAMSASGTSGSHQRVKPEDIFNISFFTPSVEKMKEFSTILEPNYLKQIKNQQQIKTLEKMRDTLLPKLMSGEVKINLGDSND